MIKALLITASFVTVMCICGCGGLNSRPLEIHRLPIGEYVTDPHTLVVQCRSELCIIPYGVRIESSEFVTVDVLLIGHHERFRARAIDLGFYANENPNRLLVLYGNVDGSHDAQIPFEGIRRLPRPSPPNTIIQVQPLPIVQPHFIMPATGGAYVALVPIRVRVANMSELLGSAVAIELKPDFPWDARTEDLNIETSRAEFYPRLLEIE